MTHTAINSHSLGEQRASEYWDDTNYCTKHWGEETQAFGQCEHGFSDAQNNMLDAYLGEEQQDEGNAMYSNSQKCTFKQVAYAERKKRESGYVISGRECSRKELYPIHHACEPV